MPTLAIRLCTVSDLETSPQLADLLAEYGVESAIDGLGAPAAQFALYHQMEATGALHLFGAFDDEALVGFLIMIVSVLPHYGKRIASTESFFVSRAARRTGAGMKLLRSAEQHAKDLGAEGFFVSAPTGGRLDHIMPAQGYRETNRVFFRVLA